MSLAPDCGIALWNRPRAPGDASRAPTLMPPALSPKIVTLSGSPPNAAMFSFTQRERRDLVGQTFGAGAGQLAAARVAAD